MTTIRDGVRLLWALENNDLSVLFELAPHLKDQFLPGGMNLIQQIQAMMQSQNAPALPTAGQGGAKPNLGFKALAAPTFEELDDEPTVLIRTSTSTDSSMNFVTALRNMQ